MGCRMEPAIVHIVKVLQKLHFFFNFAIFFYNLHDLPKKNNSTRFPKKKLHGLTIFFIGWIFFL